MRIVRPRLLIGVASYLAVAASVASAAYIDELTTIAGTDRISHWGLEETTGTTAFDSWTAGTLDSTNNGAYSDIGGGTTIGAAGPRPSDGFLGFSSSNNAVSFSGTAAQLLQMANSASYSGVQSLTMVMWFNLPTGTQQRYFGGLSDKTTGASGRYGFGFNSNTNIRGFVRLQDGATELAADSGASGITPNYRDGNWHFLALTMADSGANKQYQIYVDGVSKFTGSVAGGAGKGLANRITSDATGALAFGNDLGDTARSFIGRMDEIAFIGRALNVGELTTLYQSAVVPEPSSMVIAAMAAIGLSVAGYRRVRD
jgi:hypothetical protein